MNLDHPLAQCAFDKAPFAFVDLEFTGLREGDEICEIGVVFTEGSEILETFQSLVYTKVEMCPEAYSIHKIRTKDCKKAPKLKGFRPLFERLNRCIVVFHGSQRDIEQLTRAFPDWDLRSPVLDTLDMVRAAFALPQNRLGALASLFRLKQRQLHRALADAQCTRELFFSVSEMLHLSDKTARDWYTQLESYRHGSDYRKTQRGLIQSALREKTTLWVRYVSAAEPHKGPTLREFAVWRIQGDRAEGWCYLRKAERVLRMQRILEARLGERSYTLPGA